MKKLYTGILIFFMFLIGMSSCNNSSSDEVEYLPVQTSEEGSWRFINDKGEIVGTQEWEFEPTVVRGGLFTVQTDNGYGVFTFDGKEAKPIDSLQNLVSVGVMAEGLIPVTPDMKRIRIVNKKGEVKFVLDPIGGQEVTSCEEKFQDGLLIVTTVEGKVGAVNTKGEVVVEPKFDEMSNFKDGYALAADYSGDYEEGPVYFIVDKEGNSTKVKGKFGYEEGDCSYIPEFEGGLVTVSGPYPETEDEEYTSYTIDTNGKVTKKGDDDGWTEYLPNGGTVSSVYKDETSTYTWKDKEGKVVMKTTGWDNSLTVYGNYVVKNGDNVTTIYNDQGEQIYKKSGDFYIKSPGGKFGLVLQKYNNETYKYDEAIILNNKGKELPTPKLYGVGTSVSVSSLDTAEDAPDCEYGTVTSAYVDVTAAASKLVSMITGSVPGKENYYLGQSVKSILEGQNTQYMSGKTFSIPTKNDTYYLATGAGFTIYGEINATANITAPTYQEYFEVHHYDWYGNAWGWKRKKQVGTHINSAATVSSFDLRLMTNHPSCKVLKEAVGKRLKKEGYTLINSDDNFEVYSNNYTEAILYGADNADGLGVLIGNSKNLKYTDSELAALAAKL